MDKIVRFMNGPFTLFETVKDRMLFATGAVIYGIIFLYLFAPFHISEWIVYTSPFKKLQFVGLVVVCGVIVYASQLIQSKLFDGNRMKIYHLFLGFFFEVLFITIPLSILYAVPANSFWVEFVQTFDIILSMAIFWYLLGLSLMKLIKIHREKKDMLSAKAKQKPPLGIDLIHLFNENGQLRLSLKPVDLLFFESADNYIIVYYLKDGRTKREMIRASLKNTEAGLLQYNCIRCHRSYIVNLHNVSSVRKNGRSYEIAIQGTSLSIPISRGYVKAFKDMLTT